MRYQINRRGSTVAIGHCKDSALKTETQIGRTLDEVARRLTRGKFYDNGVTFTADEWITLEAGDVVTFRTETEIVVAQVHLGDIFTVIDRRDLPMTLADYYMQGD